jgi:hypothetical protein
MREDLVPLAVARRLRHAGLLWEPQPGDWCAVLGGEYIADTQVGLWLVTGVSREGGLVAVMDALGRWPAAAVPARDCVWVPSVGKLKTWVRSQGFRVATNETEPLSLGRGERHVCRLTLPHESSVPTDGEGTSESEAVAEATLQVLERDGHARAAASQADHTSDSLAPEWDTVAMERIAAPPRRPQRG